MIAAYLLPYPVRGIRAPYLWVFYKMLSMIDEPMIYLVGQDYLNDPSVFAAGGRWEVKPHTLDSYGYDLPGQEDLARHFVYALPNQVFDELLVRCRANPIEVFRRMLTTRLTELEEAIETSLAAALAIGCDVEAIVTWCNCPSLSAVAARHGIAVVHLEVGPLRAPLYRPTAYVDFQGVNGNTESARRYFGVQQGAPLAISANELRAFFCRPGALVSSESACCYTGLALQVEDDSNLVAFGNGFDNQGAAVYTKLFHGTKGPILIRGHPGSIFKPWAEWFVADTSCDSLEFIRLCRHVVTINSSLGLEALLSGTPVTALGEASYGYILEVADESERLSRLTHFLFAYLVPESLLFDVDYLRFRLAGPSEADIVARHLRSYTGKSWRGETVWELIEAAMGSPRGSRK